MARSQSALLMALTGFAVLTVSMGVGRFAFTPLLPMMRAEGLLSVAAGGALASVHFVGYAIGAVLAAWLRLPALPTLLVALILIGLSTLAMGMFQHYEIWLASRWLSGVASALALVVVSTHFVGELARLGRSELQGWVFAGVGAGTALVGLVTLAVMLAGWTSATGWLIFGYATIAMAIGPVALARPQTVQSGPSRAQEKVGGTALDWRIVVPYGAMGAGYIIPATYLPLMAKTIVDSPIVFGWAWPVFGTAAAVSTVLAARLHQRFSNRQIWLVSQVVMATGLLLPVLSANILAIVIAGICVGGTFMVITMAGMKEAHRIAPANAQTMVAAMTAAFAIGQIVGPVLAGWAFELTDSFSVALLIGSALLLVTLLPMARAD